MSPFAALVGGVEIRQRQKRYPGEPWTHKKLQFVRPKTTTNTDKWDLVYSTQRPQAYAEYPQVVYESVYHHEYPQVQYHHQHQPQIQHHHHQGHHGQRQIPAPPLRGPFNPPPPPPPPQRQIEAPHPAIVAFGPVDSDNEDDIIEVIEAKPNGGLKKHKIKQKSKHHDPVLIFESDDDSSWYGGHHSRGRGRGRPKSSMWSDTSSSTSVRFRSRSRPRMQNGW